MDEHTNNLLCSKNEWTIQLLNKLSPHIIDGFKSIFSEAVSLCERNKEKNKYLMTFQNLLSRIPYWNKEIIINETNRLISESKCKYLEDIVTCIHVIHVKLLSYARVNINEKKIEINIPDFNLFIHKVYINIARALYTNIYLFDVNVTPLEKQKRNREFELLVETNIMNTVRENLPIEELLRRYINDVEELELNTDVKSDEDVKENNEKDYEEDKEQDEKEKNVSKDKVIKTSLPIQENEVKTIKEMNETYVNDNDNDNDMDQFKNKIIKEENIDTNDIYNSETNNVEINYNNKELTVDNLDIYPPNRGENKQSVKFNDEIEILDNNKSDDEDLMLSKINTEELNQNTPINTNVNFNVDDLEDIIDEDDIEEFDIFTKR